MDRPLFSRNHKASALLAAAWLAGLAGCRDKEITTYRVPKETDAPPPADTSAASDQPAIHWDTPAGWQSLPASGMRQGSFVVSGNGGSSADVSVISFPGSGGDDLANINRWRDQVKLAPITADDLPKQIQTLDLPAGTFVMADMTGTSADNGPSRTLGAWLRQPDRVWFFKMAGPPDLVGSQKDAFLGFLKSVTVTAAAAPAVDRPQAAPSNTNDLPKGSMGAALVPSSPTDMSSTPVVTDSGPALTWQAPAGWQEKTGNPMRKADYLVGSGGAEVVVTAFPSDVGGVLANVNRWRGQVGLAPVDDAGLAQATTSFDSNGLHFTVVDAANGGHRMVAALAPYSGGTWFFKLTGPDEASVAAAAPAFQDFLKTIKAP